MTSSSLLVPRVIMQPEPEGEEKDKAQEGQISIFEAPSMRLLDRKSLRAEGASHASARTHRAIVVIDLCACVWCLRCMQA